MSVSDGFGDALRRRRLEVGLTQQELARRAGVGIRTLRDLEQGRAQRPRPHSVRGLAGALGLPAVTADELVAMLGNGAGNGPDGGGAGPGELAVGILGPLVVARGTAPIEVRSSMHRMLLGVLALHPGEVLPVADLVDAVWGDRPPRTCQSLVQGYVAGLRRLLEPDRPARASGKVIATLRGGYRLEPAGGVDVQRFESLAGLARQAQLTGSTDTALDLSGQALGCWRGPLLAGDGLGIRLRQHPAAVALVRRRLDVALTAADLALGLGRHQQAAETLRGLAAEEPLHEALHARLMLALAGCGQQAEALRRYTEVRTRLADELGVEPGAELQEAHRRVLRQQVGAAPPIPATGAAAAPASLLPADIPGFTGRVAQLRQLDASLPAGPVVVAGCAGVGKTTLAVHWAYRVADRFPDGQLYLNLRGFSGPTESAMSPAEALRALLEMLAVPPAQIPTSVEALAGRYRSLLVGKRMLVLLDNARDADQVRPLLPGSPSCLALVTSRNQLAALVATEGARPMALDVLDDAEARALLAVRIGADRVAAEPAAVDAIVAACAGLPLALAIVAARAATRPAFRLAAFAGELADARGRLDVLAGPDLFTDVRAVFSWSYDALRPPAARLFRLLGLHPGPEVDASAAASLTAEPVPRVRRLLAELTGANLLIERSPGRYARHDLLRAYAAELAQAADADPDRDAAQHRLLDHYLHTARRATLLLNPQQAPITPAPALPGVEPAELSTSDEALAWLGSEQPVLLAAPALAARLGRDTQCWQLVWAVSEFFNRRGRWRDLRDLQQLALAAARRLGDEGMQADTHRRLAATHRGLGEYPQAHPHLERALDLFRGLDHRRGQALTHTGIAITYELQGRFRPALDHARQALELARAMGDRVEEAANLNGLGWLHSQVGDYRQALGYCRQAVTIQQEMGNHTGEANVWDSLGYIHHHLGQHREAITCYERAVAMLDRVGHRHPTADSLARLGDTHLAAGDHAAARAAWRRALEIFDAIEHPDADPVRVKLRDLA